MFNDFPEQQAICAFFLDFVLLPRHPDSVQGHLEHLLPLYNKTTPESPLSLATSSVALAFSGNSPTRPNDHQLARSIFGRALRKTGAAIRNPMESKKDETLMAVLLLGLFEVSCPSDIVSHCLFIPSLCSSAQDILEKPFAKSSQRGDQLSKMYISILIDPASLHLSFDSNDLRIDC